MTKFNISILQKRKIIDMIKALLPKVKRVRFKRDGIISVKTGLFRGYKIHLSELCVSILPIKLKELKLILEDKAYDSVYNQYSFMIANMLNTNSDADAIIDYLYSEYSLIKYNIKRVNISNTIEIPEQVESVTVEIRHLPVISHISNKYTRRNFKFLLDTLHPRKQTFNSFVQDLIFKIKSQFWNKRPKKKHNQLRMLLQVNLK